MAKLAATVAITLLQAGGPGSGWTHEEGHVSHKTVKEGQKELEKFNDAHLKDHIERLMIFDSDTGKLLKDQVGEYNTVPNYDVFLDNNIIQMHTHPDLTSFSDGDWKSFAWANVTESRVIGIKNIYTLKKTKEWDAQGWQAHTPAKVDRRYKDIEDELTDISRDWDPDTVSDDVNRQMAKEFGCEFTVTPRKLEASKHPLQGKTRFAGMSISIENKKGSTRSGVDAFGKPWSVKMPFDYGYIGRTKGPDGDAYDCFIGPNPSAKFAYVVHQCKQTDRNKWDEDKVMLGFDSADAAIRAYKSAYNNVDLFHSMTVMPIAVFKKKVANTYGKQRHDKLHAVNYGGDVGDDYRQFREGTSLQPLTNKHPPSLKNPQRTPSDNPDDPEDKYGDKKKRRSKATKKFYKELARRQPDKPEMAETTLFVPLSQG